VLPAFDNRYTDALAVALVADEECRADDEEDQKHPGEHGEVEELTPAHRGADAINGVALPLPKPLDEALDLNNGGAAPERDPSAQLSHWETARK